jgi:hypothetical protein
MRRQPFGFRADGRRSMCHVFTGFWTGPSGAKVAPVAPMTSLPGPAQVAKVAQAGTYPGKSHTLTRTWGVAEHAAGITTSMT